MKPVGINDSQGINSKDCRCCSVSVLRLSEAIVSIPGRFAGSQAHHNQRCKPSTGISTKPRRPAQRGKLLSARTWDRCLSSGMRRVGYCCCNIAIMLSSKPSWKVKCVVHRILATCIELNSSSMSLDSSCCTADNPLHEQLEMQMCFNTSRPIF